MTFEVDQVPLSYDFLFLINITGEIYHERERKDMIILKVGHSAFCTYIANKSKEKMTMKSHGILLTTLYLHVGHFKRPYTFLFLKLEIQGRKTIIYHLQKYYPPQRNKHDNAASLQNRDYMNLSGKNNLL